jgi:hypothetical protein
VILLFGSAAFWGVYKYRSAPKGPFRNEYQGRVVDKWASYTQSEQGSRPYFRLVVEGEDKVRFQVSVSADIYERAKVGMRVKKTEKGVELMADESRSQISNLKALNDLLLRQGSKRLFNLKSEI